QYAKDDFRSVARYVTTHREPGTASVLVGGAGSTRLFKYYGDEETLDGKYMQLEEDGDFAEQVEDLTDHAGHVIMVVNRESSKWPPGSVKREMDRAYALVDEAAFTRFKVYHYRQVAGSR
ncbi:MAG: hypothetical protein MI757_17530, partial [Pirellulales bacterium]|nr:hypothetical protein [Pirellulales bacterium]